MVGRPKDYDDEHRIFVQGIMCKGILNHKEVLALHEKALKATNTEVPEKKSERQEMLVKMMQVINENLEKVGLIIRKGVDEDSGESFFMLVNTQERVTATGGHDLARKVQGEWSSAELEYLRLLATEILQSDSKSITCTTALNLTHNVAGKRLSMTEAEKSINKLLAAKWLKQITKDSMALGVRFLGEMEGWMSDVLQGDVSKCPTCRKIVVRGTECPSCDVIYHRYCLSRQLAKAKEGGKEMKCLKCKNEINLAAAGGGAGRRRRDESPNRGGRRDEEEHGGGMSQVDEGRAGPSGTQGRRKRISRPATDSDSD